MQDIWANMGAGMKINPGAEPIAQGILYFGQIEVTQGRGEVDQHINVALGAGLIARH